MTATTSMRATPDFLHTLSIFRTSLCLGSRFFARKVVGGLRMQPGASNSFQKVSCDSGLRSPIGMLVCTQKVRGPLVVINRLKLSLWFVIFFCHFYLNSCGTYFKIQKIILVRSFYPTHFCCYSVCHFAVESFCGRRIVRPPG